MDIPRRTTRRELPVVLALAALLLLFSAAARAEPYSNVASFWALGMGARPLAMGDAFVGLADDENALLRNQAGLAWGDGLSVLSAVEVRPYTASYGHVSACLENFGLSLHYFDFGEVPQMDEFGNAIGTFSYRNYGLVIGTGVVAANPPFLPRMPLADCVAFGLSVKLSVIDTLDAGDGHGFATDFSLLFRLDDPWFRAPYLTRLAFGVQVKNLLAKPIRYTSGHHERWLKEAAVGSAIEITDSIIASLQVTSADTVHLGVEWSPVPGLALRGGLKREGLWLWSLGAGLEFGRFTFNYALVFHPHLRSQHRGAVRLSW